MCSAVIGDCRFFVAALLRMTVGAGAALGMTVGVGAALGMTVGPDSIFRGMTVGVGAALGMTVGAVGAMWEGRNRYGLVKAIQGDESGEPPLAALDSGPVSGTGQALRRNHHGLVRPHKRDENVLGAGRQATTRVASTTGLPGPIFIVMTAWWVWLLFSW